MGWGQNALPPHMKRERFFGVVKECQDRLTFEGSSSTVKLPFLIRGKRSLYASKKQVWRSPLFAPDPVFYSGP